MRRTLRPYQPLVLILAVLAILCCWYVAAADYSPSALAGHYVANEPEKQSILILRADGTFEQEFKGAGKDEHLRGTWRRVGEGGIVFSKEFEITYKRSPSGETYACARKQFLNLVPFIALGSDCDGPKYRKLLFHSARR